MKFEFLGTLKIRQRKNQNFSTWFLQALSTEDQNGKGIIVDSNMKKLLSFGSGGSATLKGQ